ncbi:uncharacterized protein Dana_GF19767 [Drosophila ananassae]|uniref:Uncharacterized protein n=1 Tax=Drosophila ananassae TaxID=7217 RepID=B3MFN1_DROAN|nr:uncharacterized protein LOC6502510 [Drosophila ananassae]EDV37721.2 uncharacterized protein Dana_GF19767 [Drosophila ananassae]
MSEPEELPVEELPKRSSRQTIWYSIENAVEEKECPSCGKPMKSFKNRFAHIKKCFSIRKLGPVYRLHGYAECICGLLIADMPKAKKMHVCLGKIPAFEPEVYFESLPPVPAASPPPEPSLPESSRLPEKNTILKPKKQVWIRNFSSPIKPRGVQLLDTSPLEKPRARVSTLPRVRNFDRPPPAPSPEEVCVYSIIRQNGSIALTGRSILTQRGCNENITIVRKRIMRQGARKGGLS